MSRVPVKHGTPGLFEAESAERTAARGANLSTMGTTQAHNAMSDITDGVRIDPNVETACRSLATAMRAKQP